MCPDRDIKVLVQKGRGKGDAVRLGFSQASGDLLMILDADLSVAPEDLPQFYDALVKGKGEFINGSRLVYAKDPQAMRFLNLLGNKFFALLLTRLLGQPVKDTLCGTKVLYRCDYERIARGRAYFGDFDPFGDFDLLFGAAKQNLKIIEIPIRYRQRIYGTTNISRFTHGWLLVQMCVHAARKLLFVA
jgi:glycosyltransferase involved in cell wall biosynthesis